jgi:hypothetical protein
MNSSRERLFQIARGTYEIDGRYHFSLASDAQGCNVIHHPLEQVGINEHGLGFIANIFGHGREQFFARLTFTL